MKSILYDLITGVAIIMSLFVITNVMRANQNFITGQSKAVTGQEQVYIDENTDVNKTYKENTYTAADVYGTFHTLLENGNNTTDISRWKMYEYTEFILTIGPNTYKASFRDSDSNRLTNITNIENILNDYINNSINTHFYREKEGTFDTTLNHKVTIYTFTYNGTFGGDI